VYVCSCFGVTEEQVRAHRESGARTPRQIASACKAGTDCGSCVRRIQALLGRSGATPRRYAGISAITAVEPVSAVDATLDAVVAAETAEPPAAAA
jgi:bacterioferritin-associated ferredoxin